MIFFANIGFILLQMNSDSLEEISIYGGSSFFRLVWYCQSFT